MDRELNRPRNNGHYGGWLTINFSSGQVLPVEPVEMSALVESAKQEARPVAFGEGG